MTRYRHVQLDKIDVKNNCSENVCVSGEQGGGGSGGRGEEKEAETRTVRENEVKVNKMRIK